MSELIELERIKKKPSEKQIENLRKMREKKQEINKAKKILGNRVLENRVLENRTLESEPEKKKSEIENENLISRLTSLEKEISEIKLRKQIKNEMKNKLKNDYTNLKKSVDKDEYENQQKEIIKTQENIKSINYNNLFY